MLAGLQGLLHISIHAPVKGATMAFGLDQLSEQISIHAPVKGATPMSLMRFLIQLFQSTLP